MAQKPKKFFAANWKANPKTPATAKIIARAFSRIPKGEVAVFPPNVFLLPLVDVFSERKIKIGIQNVWQGTEGSFTGEVTAPMAKSIGASFVLVGHSERRAYNHETNADVAEKVSHVLAAGLTPILCVGESKQVRARGFSSAASAVLGMLRESLANVRGKKTKEIIVAYEPVWAIGAKKSATLVDAVLMTEVLKKELVHLGFSRFRILYGGAIDEKNISEFWQSPQLDGVLVGRASVRPQSIRKMLDVISR